MQMPYAYEEAHRARVADGLATGKIDLLLAADVGGEVVGSAGLTTVGPALRRCHAMVLGISELPRSQRWGVGTALMQALCDYADRWMGVLRIELAVYVDNEGAIALYRRFGFEIAGCHRGCALRDGAFVNAYAMARRHPAPPAIGAAQ